MKITLKKGIERVVWFEYVKELFKKIDYSESEITENGLIIIMYPIWTSMDHDKNIRIAYRKNKDDLWKAVNVSETQVEKLFIVIK